MSLLKYIPIILLSLLGGVLFFAYQDEWLIIRMPQIGIARSNKVTIKKNITIYFWHDNEWYTEKQDLLWNNDTADNLYSVVTNWLNTLDAEEISPETVILQAALISPSGIDAYLSFDRNPLHHTWSTFEKLMWVEGLLKTIREQQLSIQNIHMLVHHQPLIDRHIDTLHAWPISGFLA